MKNFVTKANISGGDDSGTATLQGAKEQNSVNDELKNFVVSAEQTPTAGQGDDPDTEMLSRGITIASQTAHGFQDSGVANSYILSSIGTLKQPSSYVDRERLTFITANANTGASTINVTARGVKKILLQDGITDLSGGEIKANGFTELIYSSSADGGSGAYLYAPWSGGKRDVATAAEIRTGADNAKTVTPLGINDTILGMGQTWTDVTGSRSANVAYTNSTGKPIQVALFLNSSAIFESAAPAQPLTEIARAGTVSGSLVFAIIPDGWSYLATSTSFTWWELR